MSRRISPFASFAHSSAARVGDADVVVELRRDLSDPQLLLDLRPRPVDHDDADAERPQQREVLADAGEPPREDGLAADGEHEDLALERVDVRRDRAKPGHELRAIERVAELAVEQRVGFGMRRDLAVVVRRRDVVVGGTPEVGGRGGGVGAGHAAHYNDGPSRNGSRRRSMIGPPRGRRHRSPARRADTRSVLRSTRPAPHRAPRPRPRRRRRPGRVAAPVRPPRVRIPSARSRSPRSCRSRRAATRSRPPSATIRSSSSRGRPGPARRRSCRRSACRSAAGSAPAARG